MKKKITNNLPSNILLNDVQKKAIEIHYALLTQWKEVHNLTSINTMNKIIDYHYMDCLVGLKSILNYCEIPNIIHDYGTGAGFPGVIAAILWPNRYVNLVESSSKKCSFLKVITSTIGLKNIKILNKRVEEIKNADFVITRAAFAPHSWKIFEKTMSNHGRVAFWVSEKNTIQELNGWILEKQMYYCISNHIKRRIVLYKINN